MPYPVHLLPKRHYRRIPFERWLENHYLLRHTKDKDLLDPETYLLKLDHIVVNTDHLRDFSINLTGVYRPEDRYWGITKERMDDYYGEIWQEGEEVIAPPDGEVTFHEERGAFYLKIGDFAGKIVHAQGEAPKSFVCDVLHTPIRCNFWHFSLRWRDEGGEHVQAEHLRRDIRL